MLSFFDVVTSFLQGIRNYFCPPHAVSQPCDVEMSQPRDAEMSQPRDAEMSQPGKVEVGREVVVVGCEVASPPPQISLPKENQDLSQSRESYFVSLATFISKTHQDLLTGGGHSNIRWTAFLGASCSKTRYVPVRAYPEADEECTIDTLFAQHYIDGSEPWVTRLGVVVEKESLEGFYMVTSPITLPGLETNAIIQRLVVAVPLEATGLPGSKGNILIAKVDRAGRVLDIERNDWFVIQKELLTYFSAPGYDPKIITCWELRSIQSSIPGSILSPILDPELQLPLTIYHEEWKVIAPISNSILGVGSHVVFSGHLPCKEEELDGGDSAISAYVTRHGTIVRIHAFYQGWVYFQLDVLRQPPNIRNCLLIVPLHHTKLSKWDRVKYWAKYPFLPIESSNDWHSIPRLHPRLERDYNPEDYQVGLIV
ncbi:hypothetical protein BKA70DRAFT_1240633 [Coprinopsis sp. MPI-PUGE-AT-0042]|nr:hypothetical protein BKA70DRAFT_1242506 [Coprinopsis sp. MPI-PUGE-AT-0042]KAH6874223.1 hypothetical protein BKA70DRAFT_1240633 [Coprinopsis sp. MPI-PUGE-AT-0042]